ncbi:MAG: diguanylate cyclase [Desulfobacteraceae bacterium]|jgi:two-component system cell cycle response regulator|nr:diguanylate cyclase [Desulfobacteraceae bacterium]
MTASILIVDDDHAVRNSIQEFLTILEFDTYSADSAESALTFLETRHVDVIITDIIMNGMDGLQMTKIVKDKYDVDIIVITGYTGNYSYEDAIEKGADDFIFKPVRFEELLLRLKRVLRERALTQERTLMLERLKELAITDDLTKLYNSRHFYNQLENEINRYKRYQRPLSLLLIDVDHFKEYNDTYGHLEGDKVLFNIAKLIKSCLRTMDTAYRYGGEEFTVILPETTCNAAMMVSERINKVVKDDLFIEDDKKDLSVSIGVTEYLPGELVTEFVRRADKAMYIAKEGGRNRTSFLLP